MKCKLNIDEALISAYVDGELTQVEQQKMARHLPQCPECEATRHELAGIKALVKTKSEVSALPAYFWMRVQARLDTADRGAPSTSRQAKPATQPIRWGAILALSAVTAVALVSLLQNLRPRSERVFPPMRGQALDAAQLAGGFQRHQGTDDASCQMADTPCQMRDDLASTQEAATWLSKVMGHPVTAPNAEQVGYHVAKAGPCSCMTPGKAALIICKKGDHTVAYLQSHTGQTPLCFPGSKLERIRDREVSVAYHDGLEIIGWHDDQSTCALMGNQQDSNDLAQLVAPQPAGNRPQSGR